MTPRAPSLRRALRPSPWSPQLAVGPDFASGPAAPAFRAVHDAFRGKSDAPAGFSTELRRQRDGAWKIQTAPPDAFHMLPGERAAAAQSQPSRGLAIAAWAAAIRAIGTRNGEHET